jgi:hypothetical protein
MALPTKDEFAHLGAYEVRYSRGCGIICGFFQLKRDLHRTHFFDITFSSPSSSGKTRSGERFANLLCRFVNPFRFGTFQSKNLG